VVRDEKRSRTIAESSIIIEYLDQVEAGKRPLFPASPTERLEVGFWDRLIDNYAPLPLQKIVGDRIRPEASRDPWE